MWQIKFARVISKLQAYQRHTNNLGIKFFKITDKHWIDTTFYIMKQKLSDAAFSYHNAQQ